MILMKMSESIEIQMKHFVKYKYWLFSLWLKEKKIFSFNKILTLHI